MGRFPRTRDSCFARKLSRPQSSSQALGLVAIWEIAVPRTPYGSSKLAPPAEKLINEGFWFVRSRMLAVRNRNRKLPSRNSMHPWDRRPDHNPCSSLLVLRHRRAWPPPLRMESILPVQLGSTFASSHPLAGSPV
jgi:hypothetical protein